MKLHATNNNVLRRKGQTSLVTNDATIHAQDEKC